MWNKIYFEKSAYNIPLEIREWNNRRLGAAKRALKKEKERAGLFPELMRFNSVEERVEQIDSTNLARIKDFRRNEASDIWECRKRFRTLPNNIKNDVIEYWSKTYVPKVPFRFLSLITRYEQDNLYFERIKGNASKFIKNVIVDGKIKIIEVSSDEYYAHINKIDKAIKIA